MTNLSDLAAKVERLEALAKAATPGPWAIENCGEKCTSIVIGHSWRLDDDAMTPLVGWLEEFDDDGDEIDYYRCGVCSIDDSIFDNTVGGSEQGNAEFIAESHNSVTLARELLDRLQEAEGDAERYRLIRSGESARLTVAVEVQTGIGRMTECLLKEKLDAECDAARSAP